ncbi:MAG: hypothetical protein J6X44_09040 [Thermoguttaceae bacterium]|nr:hypothetical protein [Thermoguttaceae bacterium]
MNLQQFLMECSTTVPERTQRWHDRLGIGSWTFDGKSGLIKFQLRNGSEVAYAAQIVGSLNENTQTFLWSWANSSIPENLSEAAAKVREIGEERNWNLLTNPKFECDQDVAFMLTCAASELTKLPFFYRGPAGNGVYLFFIFGEEETESTEAEPKENRGVFGKLFGRKK